MKKIKKLSIVLILFPCFVFVRAAEQNDLQQSDGIEIESKEVEKFISAWSHIEKIIAPQYDENEYLEINIFRIRVKRIKKPNDQDKIVLTEKEARKLVSAWDDLELLLLCVPRAYTRASDDLPKSIDIYDISKARKFIAQVRTRLYDAALYRLFCSGKISNVIGTCNDNANPLDCTYANVTDLMTDINALCPIVTILRTILAELRGVGPGPAFCP